MIRVAAAADIHIGADNVERLHALVDAVAPDADVLVLAGDLTHCGDIDEGRLLADGLRRLDIPVVAVLGNHDVHADMQQQVVAALEDAGVRVLDGDIVRLDVADIVVGIAGVPGFGFGFPGRACSEFGEPETKAFARRGKREADRLADALADLEACDIRIAVTHYSPVRETLRGEPPEIHPFLGNYLLAEAIDTAPFRITLALHGHAHHGSERGTTPGGVPVRNVAVPVLRRAYARFDLEPRSGDAGTTEAVDASWSWSV